MTPWQQGFCSRWHCWFLSCGLRPLYFRAVWLIHGDSCCLHKACIRCDISPCLVVCTSTCSTGPSSDVRFATCVCVCAWYVCWASLLGDPHTTVQRYTSTGHRGFIDGLLRMDYGKVLSRVIRVLCGAMPLPEALLPNTIYFIEGYSCAPQAPQGRNNLLEMQK